MMSTKVKVEEADFDTIEILDDNAIEQEVEDLIDLLGDDDDNEDEENSLAVRYPGLTSKSTKRDHDDNGMFFSHNQDSRLSICIFVFSSYMKRAE